MYIMQACACASIMLTALLAGGRLAILTGGKMIDPAQWSVTHGGKTFTVNSFMELVRAAQSLRTPEEKLQGAMRVMKAVDAMLEEPHPIEGLGSMTNEDGGFLTLRFKDEDAAQLFMQEYHPTVEANDMPPWPDDQPIASDYSDMLRAFCCKYSAGGWNSEGLMAPDTALAKLEWIVEDAINHAKPK